MKNLKKLREEKGLSQKEFANIFNASQNSISQWETGTREPDNKMLLKIAEFFDVSVDYLLGKESEDDEVYELRDMLRKRPELKILFSVSKNASKEQIEKTADLIETFKKQRF